MRALPLLLLLGGPVACSSGPPPQTDGENGPGKQIRILLVTQSLGYKHATAKRSGGELSLIEKTLTELGESTGLFTVECTQDVTEDFTREKLDKSDIVMFYTTGMLPIRESALDYFLNDWLKQKGHGFFGLHCASDTFKSHEPYWRMLGGTFAGHGKYGHAGPPFTVTVHEPDHPLCRPWKNGFEIDDEVYLFRNWQPDRVRILMSVDMEKTAIKMQRHVPFAWCRNHGEGRVLYFVLGHEARTWGDERYRRSLINGIKWIAGLEPGEASPNPKVSAAEERKAKAAFEKAKKPGRR